MMDPRAYFWTAVALLAACRSGGEQPSDVASLPALAADPVITVSGLSSGGYMAGQYHVAFSSDVAGAGIVAAGPWGCAQGEITRALGECLTGDGIETGGLTARAQTLVASGSIDPLTGLAGDHVYLFHGRNDSTVASGVVREVASWYESFVDDAGIVLVDGVAAGHGLPTVDDGIACEASAAPYINACRYDLAGELLGHLYGELHPAVQQAGAAMAFDQSAFGDAELAEFGYVYVPASCREAPGCRIHVFFHGCTQSAEVIGTALVERGGFNRWAESNGIVVLYPQVAASKVSPVNPLGCWDWWGYTGDEYLTRDGAQLAAVRAMVTRLSAD